MRENRPLLRKFQSLREKKTMPAVLSALSVKIWDPHYAVRTKTKAGASRK
jgi:hypothetical protein